MHTLAVWKQRLRQQEQQQRYSNCRCSCAAQLKPICVSHHLIPRPEVDIWRNLRVWLEPKTPVLI